MTADEKLKLLIGELTIQVIVLRTENEQLKLGNAQLEKENEQLKAEKEAAARAQKEPGKPEV